MASRALIALFLVSAMLTVGCGSTNVSKSGAPSGAARTLHLLSAGGRAGIDGDFTPIFHGKQPFLPGDSYIVWDNLRGGGFQSTYCVIARQDPHRTFWCTRTYTLRAGQITAAGDYDNSPDGDSGTLPVVGGTGAYEGARGTVTIGGHRRGGGITIHLR